MSILTNNGKVFTLGGSVVKYTPPPPVKGDLINMDLDGNGNKTYRVLAMNGNVTKLLGMDDITFQAYNSDGNDYAGSDLDIYLNTTWYNTLSTGAKTAIVSESRVQYAYQYYDEPNEPNTPTYMYQYQYKLNSSDYDNVKFADHFSVGDRNVFALGLKDIFDYFDKVCITSNELMKLWTNQTSAVRNKDWWLSSMSADDGGRNFAWSIDGNLGSLGTADTRLQFAVRPAFNIDLSKIPFTKTTEVI